MHLSMNNNLILNQQPNHAFFSFPKLSEKDGILTASMSSRYAFNVVRSCSHPFPGAFVFDKDKTKIRIWSMKLLKNKISQKQFKYFINFENNFLILKFRDGLFITDDYDILTKNKT